jgi:hypothetical protein
LLISQCSLLQLLAPAEENDRGELALLGMWALFSTVYPITRPADYQDKEGKPTTKCVLYGRAMASVNDTHFVQVDPALGYQAVNAAAGKQPKQVLEEVVLKNEAQLLPRYIIYFKDLAFDT